MVTKAKLEEALRTLAVDEPSIDVDGGPMYVVTVTSGSFASESEATRQATVWRHLQSTLSPDELKQVEFVFANAPGEESSPGDEQT